MLGGMVISAAWLGTVVLLTLRLTAVFTLTPLFSASSVPLMVRVLVVLGLATALSSGGGLPGGAAPAGLLASPGLMIQAAFTELALGAVLALGVLLAMAAFSAAGELLGIQMGLGMGNVLDPITNRSEPVTASVFNQLGVLVFFLSGGHHALLRGIAFSLERFPLGRPWPLELAVEPMLKQVMALFTLSFALAVPVVFCLLMLEMALGVVARNMPQMNMIAMGIPVKIVVGLVALALWVAGMGGAMARVYGSIYRTWDAIFTASRSLPRLRDALAVVELAARRSGVA